MALIPDVRIAWRGTLTSITNSAFLVNTGGWGVDASGINAAATSITRGTGDGVLGGVTTNCYATLVTTSTNTSGTRHNFGGTFTSGRTYRFSVWLKSVSGTTSARMVLGSIGTAGDRGTATFTLTTSWARYTVDWTPSGSRTDAAAVITNNAASVMTARVCLADVYEAIDDIGSYGSNLVDELSWGRGASFNGTSESPGSCSLTANSIDGRFSVDNASGPYYGLIAPDKPVYVRTVDTSALLVYGAFYGTTRRVIPRPWERKAEILAEDPLFRFGKNEVNLGASITRSIRDFRVAILDAIGESVARQDLAYGPEADIGYTGSDTRLALGLLDDLNVAAGSVHYIKPHPAPEIAYQYTTVDRTELQSWTSAEHLDDASSGKIVDLSDYDVNDESLVTFQRVTPTIRDADDTATVLWTSTAVPVVMDTGDTVFAFFDEAEPAIDQTLSATLSPLQPITLTPYAHAALITVGVGGPTNVTALSISARVVREVPTQSVSSGSGDFSGSVITSDFIPSHAHAKGLADWIVYRYGTVKPRPEVTVENRTATHTQRDIAQPVTLSFGLLSIASKGYFIRALRTVVSDSALVWRTTLTLEEAPASTDLFTVGGSAAQGVGGTGILAR